MKILPGLLVSAIFASTFFFSCNNVEKAAPAAESKKPAFDVSTAQKEIEEVNRKFMDMLIKGDSAGIGNLYTKDAKLMFAGTPAVYGRPGIQTVFSKIINSGVTRVALETLEVYGSEDLLAEEGRVTVYIGERPVSEEKSIILWKKEDGQWKIFRDIANSNTK